MSGGSELALSFCSGLDGNPVILNLKLHAPAGASGDLILPLPTPSSLCEGPLQYFLPAPEPGAQGLLLGSLLCTSHKPDSNSAFQEPNSHPLGKPRKPPPTTKPKPGPDGLTSVAAKTLLEQASFLEGYLGEKNRFLNSSSQTGDSCSGFDMSLSWGGHGKGKIEVPVLSSTLKTPRN